MQILCLFMFFANVFGQVQLRGYAKMVKESDFQWKEFTSFQERFSKRYSSLEELETRFSIFRENLVSILNHNADVEQNFTMGVNQFTDLTPEEFKKLYVTGLKEEPTFGCKSFSSDSTGLPDSIDWRSQGIVNPIRDQGQCGSCWAFATTANAESVWALQNGELLDLSEEFLVDCATGLGYFNMGCNGGNEDSAFKYMINYGQVLESVYPYTAGTTQTAGKCQKTVSAPVKFSSCSDVKANDQISLKAAVSKQPVTIAIEADTRYFQSYSSGILTDSIKCGTTLDHAVEIVGYGQENGIKYWLVRNSWGTTWGEQGYVKIERSESTNDIGVCGIAAEPSFLSV
jgi:C1A family cysteine protease